MTTSKNLRGGSAKDAAGCAHSARTAPANSNRSVPPSGPKPEPARLNGVPRVGKNGTK